MSRHGRNRAKVSRKQVLYARVLELKTINCRFSGGSGPRDHLTSRLSCRWLAVMVVKQHASRLICRGTPELGRRFTRRESRLSSF